ncbi:ATP-binding cassette domain-containing protein [Arenimonas terrae]|jgi:peptide/nickel transport system ATP-binding protein|uniref:ABC-type dipeptide transporter n=1 Tax=Arenimonas terrae TaxID=2546226 RepID=A0A5C4RPN6_9GAMM|nr:ABC transporter ATP-binding protein [Arenimonas terrae]TNJ33092.1 ABC transporter ATP-binding protein [Arenimonas terrae]
MSARLALRGLQVSAGACRLLGPIDLDIAPGQCLGLVGESGSGKSLTVLSLLGLLPPGLQARGELLVDGERFELGSRAHHALRGRVIAWMPQDPQASLHPLRSVGAQLVESLRVLRGLDAGAARREAIALFERLQLPDPATLLARHPHQLSGGQRQRALLAMALAGRPRLLLADEPTSALDPRLAQEALQLLDGLRRDLGLAVLLVSHDLPAVAEHAAQVLILRGGEVVERGECGAVFARPQHDYTRELLAADRLPVLAPAPAGARLLELQSVSVTYPRAAAPAVAEASLELHRGQCLALVGESGSGKSSLGRAVLRLAKQGLGGRILLDGEDLLGADRHRLRALRRRIGVVFQDPYASLDPRMRLVDLVAEPLRIHGLGDPAARRAQALAGLAAVGLDAALADRYPHQLSGGQRQRVAIARALATGPDLLVCDEAVSALDAHHRAGVLALLARLKRERGLALLFITHDFAAAHALADRTALMRDGRLVAVGDTATVLAGTARAG